MCVATVTLHPVRYKSPRYTQRPSVVVDLLTPLPLTPGPTPVFRGVHDEIEVPGLTCPFWDSEAATKKSPDLGGVRGVCGGPHVLRPGEQTHPGVLVLERVQTLGVETILPETPPVYRGTRTSANPTPQGRHGVRVSVGSVLVPDLPEPSTASRGRSQRSVTLPPQSTRRATDQKDPSHPRRTGRTCTSPRGEKGCQGGLT